MLDLIQRTLARVFVVAPAENSGAMSKPSAGEMVVGNFWRVRVLEFVLERRRLYSSVANATLIAKNRIFPS